MTTLRPLAIYIHWPWCKAKCPYCDFNSHAGAMQEDAYVEGLLREIKAWHSGRSLGRNVIAPYSRESHTVISIFFGGGTPSLMSASSISRIIDACGTLGILDDKTEITVECNPTSFDSPTQANQFFSDLQNAGVNRVSIGIQGLKTEWLRFLGREHSVSDALATLDAAQKQLRNVNTDIIYGLPEQNLAEWNEMLEKLAARQLSHISAYQLTIEKNTRFYMDVKRGTWSPIDNDAEADFFDATKTILESKGYENYEISNFAQPGYACRHNVHVWQYGEYLGIGAGAHGRVIDVNGQRMATHVIRQPDGYLKRTRDLNEHAFESIVQSTSLHPLESVQEALFSGLRLSAGCKKETLNKLIPRSSLKEAISERETADLICAGFLEEHEQHLRLTPTGWPRLNSVLSRLLLPLTDLYNPASSIINEPQTAYNNVKTVIIT